MSRPATSPLMITAKDDDLLGVSNRSDAMGVLAVWSVRGRDLVPHLTEQTTHVRVIEGHSLNSQLAERLLEVEALDHRTFLAAAARELADHRATIEDAVRCEDLLAVVEAIFLWLCASKGKTVAAAVADLPVDLDVLSAARAAFGHSGAYRGDTAVSRQSRFHEQLDTSSTVALARMPERKHFIDDGTEPWSGTLYAKLYASVVHTKGLPAFLQGSRSRRPSEMWAYSPYWSDVAEQVSAWGARKTVLVPALPRTGPFPPRRGLFVRNRPIGGAGNAAHIAYPPRLA